MIEPLKVHTSGYSHAGNGNKPEASILHLKILEALNKKCYKNGSGIIKFADVHLTLSWVFHLNKNDRWIFLRELEVLGLIEIKPFHGIRIIRQG